MLCNHYPELNNLRRTPAHGQIININETQYSNCCCDVPNAIKMPFATKHNIQIVVVTFQMQSKCLLPK